MTLKNVLDRAVLAHAETHAEARIPEYTKVDEIPFDFERRITSVVVRTPGGKDLVVSKGAPEAVFPRCTSFTLGGKVSPLDRSAIDRLKAEYERLSADGFRVLAIASREVEPRGAVAGDATPYSQADEHDLTLDGYVAFLDMGASSNFGNMFSVLGASLFVPYLPMTPIQILANNILYDVSQTAIPTDDVDPEQVEKPRPWDIGRLTRTIVFIGPCSSLFDFTTFFVMLHVFHCRDIGTPDVAAHSESLFQTGWFVESLLTQTRIIHVICTDRIPFVQSRASWPLMAMTAVIMAVGVGLPATTLGTSLGFTPLPWLSWPLLAGSLVGYVIRTQVVKTWLLRKGWI